MITAIIVAAGNSERFGENKLLLPYGTGTVLEAAMLPFINLPEIDDIILVANLDDNNKFQEIFDKYNSVKPVKIVEGGKSRTESVKNALKYLDNTFVLIHDGARPNVKTNLIQRVIEKMMSAGACVPVIDIKESIRNEDGALPREWFKNVQTPQGFEVLKLKMAYETAEDSFNDDAAVYESMFGIVDTVEGDVDNVKITYPNDYYGLISKRFAVGVGYDVHCLVENRKLILGGVEIPFEKGLVSHSDGDVLIHALMDALLTAINEGDIGKHFPENDPKYENISSLDLLEKVAKMVKAKNFIINNISAIIMAEAPRLSAYIPKMCINIGKILDIDPSKIGIAATTTEGLGIVSEGKGIAAYCVVSLFSDQTVPTKREC